MATRFGSQEALLLNYIKMFKMVLGPSRITFKCWPWERQIRYNSCIVLRKCLVQIKPGINGTTIVIITHFFLTVKYQWADHRFLRKWFLNFLWWFTLELNFLDYKVLWESVISCAFTQNNELKKYPHSFPWVWSWTHWGLWIRTFAAEEACRNNFLTHVTLGFL